VESGKEAGSKLAPLLELQSMSDSRGRFYKNIENKTVAIRYVLGFVGHSWGQTSTKYRSEFEGEDGKPFGNVF